MTGNEQGATMVILDDDSSISKFVPKYCRNNFPVDGRGTEATVGVFSKILGSKVFEIFNIVKFSPKSFSKHQRSTNK